MYDPANLGADRLGRLCEKLDADLRTGRAFGYRINFGAFWECESRDEGRKFIKTWYAAAIRSRLHAIKSVAWTLKAHLEGLLNYFTHRITNAMSEGLNIVIQ